MYLTHLHVKNWKLLRDFSLDFRDRAGKPRKWTVLIGENGTGKTSILQAIGLSAAGNRQVNTLAYKLAGHLRGRLHDEALEITADFEFGKFGARDAALHPAWPPVARGKSYRLRSQVGMAKDETVLWGGSRYLYRGKPLEGSADPLDTARAKGLPLWFVAGYGISRILPDVLEQPSLRLPAIDRLQPLFDPVIRPISTAFSNLFAEHEGKALQYHRILKSALFNLADTLPNIRDLELRGRGGLRHAGDLLERNRFIQVLAGKEIKVPLVALSHGYQSTVAWIADLVGHVLLESEEPVEPEQMEGLVLIDELDLYLHPAWQAAVVTALRRTFPRLQFIASTHSPVILSGLEPCEIVKLGGNGEGDIVRLVPNKETGEWAPQVARDTEGPTRQPDPRTMTGTEIYRAYMDIDRLTLNPQGDDLRRYTALACDPDRNDYEEARMLEARDRLEIQRIGGLRQPVQRRARE